MKIPLILAREEIPAGVPYPRASGDAYAAGAEAIYRGARTLERAGHMLTDIIEQVEHQQASDETGRLLATVPEQIEAVSNHARLPASDSNPLGVPEGETPSQTYVQRVRRGLDQVSKSLVDQATLGRAKKYLRPRVDRALGSAMAQAQVQQFALFRDEQASEIPEVLARMESAAIANPDQRAMMQIEAESYLKSKTGILSAVTQQKMLGTFREGLAWGVAVRAVDQDPDRDLAPYIRDLTSENALKLQDHARAVKARVAAELKESQRALDHGMKVYLEGVERHFVRGLDAGTIGEDDFATFGEYLTAEKLDLYRKAYRERETGGGPGDPTTIRAFKSAVYSADLRSEADVQRISGQLRGAFDADLVPEREYTPMASHLQSLADRFNQRSERADARSEARRDAQAERRQAETERVSDAIYAETREHIRHSLKSTGGLSLDFDAVSEDAVTMALEDLSRETGRGRLQAANGWWEKNRPRYLARVQTRAASRMTQLRQSLSPRIPELQTDPLSQEFRSGLIRLHNGKATYTSESEWLEDVRRSRELWQLSRTPDP